MNSNGCAQKPTAFQNCWRFNKKQKKAAPFWDVVVKILSVHPETPDETLLAFNLETRDFLSLFGLFRQGGKTFVYREHHKE